MCLTTVYQPAVRMTMMIRYRYQPYSRWQPWQPHIGNIIAFPTTLLRQCCNATNESQLYGLLSPTRDNQTQPRSNVAAVYRKHDFS